MTEIQLSEQVEAFIEDLMRNRVHKNANEVVAAGLRLPGSGDERLRAMIEPADGQVAAGDYRIFPGARDVAGQVMGRGMTQLNRDN